MYVLESFKKVRIVSDTGDEHQRDASVRVRSGGRWEVDRGCDVGTNKRVDE